VVEVFGLLFLYFSVSRYKSFWIDKANEPGEITYLALGDSAAQGIGASSPMRGYVGLVSNRIEKQTGKKVQIVNLSVTGAKMSDYLKTQAPEIKKYKADVVTIEIGANDVAKYDEGNYRSEFKKVMDTLPKGAYVSNMPLFNSRPSSTQHARDASKIIKEELKSRPDLIFVDLQKQTQENQSIFGFAPDLFHPNNLSYKNWADAFWVQIENYSLQDIKT
jgi:acyl-CoA thioesterase-1